MDFCFTQKIKKSLTLECLCFGDTITDVKTNKKSLPLISFHSNVYVKLFTKEVNLFSCWAQSNICISQNYRDNTVQKRRQRLLQQRFNFCNIPMNMAIGIRLKIHPSGLQQKCFSGDFPHLLVLRLLRTHIGGCFQSVCFRSSCLQNIHKVYRKTNVAESF